jgi:cell division protease FtsH
MVQATGLARNMVGRWGMSGAIGPVAVYDDRMVDAFGRPQVSEATMKLVDEEVRRILDECYATAVELLKDHRDRLDALTEALLAKETLEASDAYAAAGIERPARPDGHPPSPDI